MTDTPQAIHKLEEMALHQERQIQDLSDMVAAQWQELDRLKKLVQILQKKLLAMGEGSLEEGQEAMSVSEFAMLNKPPHY